MAALRRKAAGVHAGRRVGDRRKGERRAGPPAPAAGWDDQRTRYVTRYLFGALGLAYFNLGGLTVRGEEQLLAINVIVIAYLALVTLFLLHARWRLVSPARLRLAMFTDVLAVSAAVYADANLMSPGYLVYVVVILGNGMRYGLRAFAEAAASSLVCAAVVLGLRADDFLRHFSGAGLFYMLFVGIIVLYVYALLANIDRARRSLEIASNNDALTGLLNRRGLSQRADVLFRSLDIERGSIAVLFADLDGFKAVNDAHGHDAGDRLLREIGQAVTARVRGSDIVARYGGDEFIAIVPDVTLEQASVVADRFQQIVARVGDGRMGLSVTIGMGLAPQHGRNLDAVLKSVDAAMYRGKHVGRGAAFAAPTVSA